MTEVITTQFILENEALRLTFHRDTGTLSGLVVKGSAEAPDWNVLDRPELGMSYRLLVPLPQRRNNLVLGEQQQLSALALTEDGKEVHLTWEGVTSQHGGQHPITLMARIALTSCGVSFSLQVVNKSSLVVEAVDYPCLGDVRPPDTAEPFSAFSWRYSTAQQWSLWPHYDNMKGYWGVDTPTQFSWEISYVGAPMSPFILLRGPRQGLYIGVDQPNDEMVAWRTDLQPGYGDSLLHRPPSATGLNAHSSVATRFMAAHVPFLQSGEIRTLPPVTLAPFRGGWQAGVDRYTSARNEWMTLTRSATPPWVREPHAWQQLHINSPEDELRLPFRDLPQVGQECARLGVRAIQLVGWNTGGQDGNNPCHDPSPQLGTADELREAIACVQAMGVKVILFSKFTWADRSTERFRQELIDQAITDPYGDYYLHGGYQYQTTTQLLDINTRRLIPMCFLSEAYLKVCEEEFRKVLALGADGLLFDECQHHGPALLCFNTAHGHRYGAPVYANDASLIQRFAAIAQEVGKPDFLFAGESCYDGEFAAYQFAYLRSDAVDHVPLSRYLWPDVPLMTAATGFDDRNMINQALLYQYVVSYEPYNFKGRLPTMPRTVAYGQKMDALRTELREYLWDGEYRDTVGASVSTETGQSHHPYAVFTSRTTGQQAVAIANYGDGPISLTVQVDNGQPLTRVRVVDATHWSTVKADTPLTLAARSALVLLP